MHFLYRNLVISSIDQLNQLNTEISYKKSMCSSNYFVHTNDFDPKVLGEFPTIVDCFHFIDLYM